MTWPIDWPEAAEADKAAATPIQVALAEHYAVASMNSLTLNRVGGNPVTIMPGPSQRVPGHYAWYEPLPGEYRLGSFYPGTVYPSALDLATLTAVDRIEAISLPGPVGAVTEVRVDGAVLDPSAYRVENGAYLVRTDGGSWPAAGDGFTVTYLNSHPVGPVGAYAAGVMAWEWLKTITSGKKCRLSSKVTSMNRQGIQMDLTPGLFPDGVTGIEEVDLYIRIWNPNGLKTAPRVYSPDLPRHRQVWGSM